MRGLGAQCGPQGFRNGAGPRGARQQASWTPLKAAFSRLRRGGATGSRSGLGVEDAEACPNPKARLTLARGELEASLNASAGSVGARGHACRFGFGLRGSGLDTDGSGLDTDGSGLDTDSLGQLGPAWTSMG